MFVSKKFLIVFIILFTAYAHLSLTNNSRNKTEQRHKTIITKNNDLHGILDQVTLVESSGKFININAEKNTKIIFFNTLQECQQDCLVVLEALTAIQAKLPKIPGLLSLFITLEPLQDDTEQLQNFIAMHHQKYAIKMLTGEDKSILNIAQVLQETAQQHGYCTQAENVVKASNKNSTTLYLLDTDNAFISCLSIQYPINLETAKTALTNFFINTATVK